MLLIFSLYSVNVIQEINLDEREVSVQEITRLRYKCKFTFRFKNTG